MTRFTDGPAKGQILTLGRAPLFLRVAQDANGTWDALDQIDDFPKATETLYAYVRVGSAGQCFMDGRDKKTGKRRGRACVIAEYRFYEEQPDQFTLGFRKENWEAWVNSIWEKQQAMFKTPQINETKI